MVIFSQLFLFKSNVSSITFFIIDIGRMGIYQFLFPLMNVRVVNIMGGGSQKPNPQMEVMQA